MKIDWPGPFRYRAPDLEYERLSGQLLISAHERNGKQNLLIAALVAAASLGYAALHLQSMNRTEFVSVVVTIGACCWSVYRSLHPDTATLEITSSWVRARSRLGSTDVVRASLGELTFLAGNGESGDPQGLYSRSGFANTLLLAYVTEDQTYEVKDEIYKMFPDTPTGTAYPSDLTMLNLQR